MRRSLRRTFFRPEPLLRRLLNTNLINRFLASYPVPARDQWRDQISQVHTIGDLLFPKKCLIVLININRPNQVSVLQCSTDVVRDYTSRSSEHGGGTPGAHHPPAWCVSCQLNFRRFVCCQLKFWPPVTATVFPRMIAGGHYFFFRTKRGRLFKGGAYFKYCPLEVK